MQNFLPCVSEIIGEINDPNNVPKDKMEVIMALSAESKFVLPPLVKCAITYFVSSSPLIIPVSYPYKNPPSAVNTPTYMAIKEDLRFWFLLRGLDAIIFRILVSLSGFIF